MALKQDIAKKKLILAKLVKVLKKVREFKPRTKQEEIALKLAKKRGQIVYGSVVTSLYSKNIKPADIDIGARRPLHAAKELKRELLKKGIEAEIKKKYIPTLKKNIYEVNNISYAPLQKSKISKSEMIKRLKVTKLEKEVKALAKTISDPTKYYRAEKDYKRLMQIKKRLRKKKEKQKFLKEITLLKKQGQQQFFNILKKREKWF